MGSVDLDTLNPFSSTHHNFHEPSRPRPIETAQSRTEANMVGTEQRPPSASTSSRGPRPQATPTQDAGRGVSQHAQQRQVYAQPPAPARMNSATPPSRSHHPSTPAVDTPTTVPHRPRATKIKVRDLEHIQSFASEDMNAFSELSNRSRSRSRGSHDDSPQYEISGMKVEHIIEMVAGLLTKITTTNDQQHEHLHQQTPQMQGSPNLSSQTNSVLAFHGKNVPSITILSYLSRINKYCPTSYEVFLSLLVYFDRMTERVNAGPMQSLRQANEAAMVRQNSVSSSSSSSAASELMEGISSTGSSSSVGAQTVTPPSSGGLQKADEPGRPGTPHSKPYHPESPSIPPQPSRIDEYDLSHFFVVDSFNIHRLVIAGVTCASKFFSDIFYTNSRYAKVGGLPLPELNHLELQFLLLNDFRLSIPVEEIEAYGTMLVEFYAREIVAQQKAAEAEAEAMQMRSLSASSSDSTSTVQAA